MDIDDIYLIYHYFYDLSLMNKLFRYLWNIDLIRYFEMIVSCQDIEVFIKSERKSYLG